MGRGFLDLLMWTIVAAIVVLVVMNAGNVASLMTSFGGQWTQETSILTGTGYKMPKAA